MFICIEYASVFQILQKELNRMQEEAITSAS
jgi:hypothetical protein